MSTTFEKIFRQLSLERITRKSLENERKNSNSNDFNIDARSKGDTIEKLKGTRSKKFLSYLKQKYASESYECFLQIKELDSVCERKKLKEKVNSIYEKYIKKDSKCEVILPIDKVNSIATKILLDEYQTDMLKIIIPDLLTTLLDSYQKFKLE
jgi:hypothetical protein